MTIYTEQWRQSCGRWAKFRAENPHLQLSAHKLVRTALRNGTLVKENCFVCGSSNHVEAHHEDYAKPLEVVWLCRFDHAQRHQGYAVDEIRALRGRA